MSNQNYRREGLLGGCFESRIENSDGGGGRAADNLVSTNYWSICHNMSLIALSNMSIIESLLLSTLHTTVRRIQSLFRSWLLRKQLFVKGKVHPEFPSHVSSWCLVSAEIEPERADMIRINELFTRLYPGVIRLWTFYTRHYVTMLQSHTQTTPPLRYIHKLINSTFCYPTIMSRDEILKNRI